MLALCVIVNISIMTMIFLMLYSLDIVKAIVFGVTHFFYLFIVVSGIYFWIDRFSFLYSILICLFISLAILSLLFIKKHRITIVYAKDEYSILYVLVIFAIILSLNKFEFFGMGQDQGVYQTKAIELINRNYSKQIDFEEYHTLHELDKKNFAETLLMPLMGFIRYEQQRPTLTAEEKLSEVSGIYHGITTFPVLLALTGKIFGISYMMHIQTMFFLLCIFYIWFICEKLRFNLYSKIFSIFIFIFSPLMLWVSKSAFTEMFLCVIMLNYIYFLIDSENPSSKLLLCTPIISFSFFHVSIYTMMPLFALIFFYLLIKEKSKLILASSLISVLGYGAGFIAMSYISPMYTFFNYEPIYFIPFVNDNTLLYFQLLVVLLTMILLIVLYKMSLEKFPKIFCHQTSFRCLILILLLISIFHGFVLSYAKGEMSNPSQQYYYYGQGLLAFKQITLSAYMYSVSILTFIGALFFLIRRPDLFLRNRNNFLISNLFIYCILLYAAFFRPEITHYYYYSRYLAPFVPVIIIVNGIGLDQLKFRKITTSIILIISCIVIYPYTRLLVFEDDDSRLDWSILEDFSQEISQQDIVFLDHDLISRMYLPLKSMTNAKVYPNIDYKNRDFEYFAAENNSKIFIITGDAEDYYIYNKESSPSTEYIVQQSRINQTSEDASDKKYTFFPYPTNFNIRTHKIALLQKKKVAPRYEYVFSDNDFKVNGFYDLEQEFRWMKEGESSITLFLEESDYELTILQGTPVPSQVLKEKEIELKFYFNGNFLDIVPNDKIKDMQDINLFVPKAYVRDGYNELEARYNAWKPMEFEISDARDLGIAIKRIIISPIS